LEFAVRMEAGAKLIGEFHMAKECSHLDQVRVREAATNDAEIA